MAQNDESLNMPPPEVEEEAENDEESEEENNFQEHLVLFQEIHQDLKMKSTVGWKNAANCLGIALQFFDREETQIFLDHCFERIVAIMLDQHPNKLGQFEKNCVIRCLNEAMPIILGLLKKQKMLGVSVLSMIFNKKRVLYKEFRSSSMGGNYFNKSSTIPDARIQCINLFTNSHGWELLCNTLVKASDELNEDIPVSRLSSSSTSSSTSNSSLNSTSPLWLGSENAKIILQAIPDQQYSALSNLHIITTMCKCILQCLVTLPTRELKKESTDSVGGLLAHIKRLVDSGIIGPPSCVSIFQLWLSLTAKFIESTSLPQRLFGFEQISHLVHTAQCARPFPDKYEISNAGTDCVNGLYILCDDSNRKSGGKYIKQDETAGQVLTLFRCTMRSGTKWWFISEADKEQPGTDKDIDYYQNQTQTEDDNPPNSNWVATGKGQPPAPLLSPIESDENNARNNEIDDQMTSSKDSSNRLDYILMDWIEEKRILEDIFGNRIHREIVSRSSALVNYLSHPYPSRRNKGGGLSMAHLELVWKSSLGKEDILVQEIHTLLATIVPDLSDDLLLGLLRLIHQTLKQEGQSESCPDIGNLTTTDKNGSNQESTNYSNAIISFMERIAQGNIQSLFERNWEVMHRMLLLLWDLQIGEFTLNNISSGSSTTTSLTSSNKKSNPGSCIASNTGYNILGSGELISFLHKCLRSRHGETQRTIFLCECIDTIKSSCCGNKMATESSVAMVVSRSLELVKFIIETYSNDEEKAQVVEMLEKKHDFVELLMAELEVFVCCSSQTTAAIGHRLDLLHYFYGKSSDLELSIKQVDRLWAILSPKQEVREIFFVFLNRAAGSVSSTCSDSHKNRVVFSLKVAFHVFNNLICQQTHSKSIEEMGALGYRCFHTYFIGLNSHNGLIEFNGSTSQIKRVKSLDLLGMSTLWEIALTGPDTVATSAIQVLLDIWLYLDHAVDPNTTLLYFFSHVFNRFESLLTDQEHEFGHTLVVQHGIQLLTGLVAGASATAAKKKEFVQSTPLSSNKSIPYSTNLPSYRVTPAHNEQQRQGAQDNQQDEMERQQQPIQNEVLEEMLKAHGMRSQGNHYNIHIIGQYISSSVGAVASNYPNKEKLNVNGDKFGPFDLSVHSKLTLLDLRRRLQSKLNFPMEQMKLILTGINLAGEQSTLAELEVIEQATVRVLLFNNVLYNPPLSALIKQQHTDKSNLTMKHPGNLLAENQHYFEILFKLLDRIVDEVTRKMVLQFLNQIPTNVQLLSLISNSSDCCWSELFATKEEDARKNISSKSVYLLEIIDAVLLPNDENLLNLAEEWLVGFYTSNGLTELLRLFLSNNNNDRPGRGSAVLLRLLKFCLFNSSRSNNPKVLAALEKIELTKDANYEKLLDKLCLLVVKSHRKLNDVTTLVLDALEIIQAIVIILPCSWGQDEKNICQEVKGFVEETVTVLISNEEVSIRERWLQTIESLIKQHDFFSCILVHKLCDHFPPVSCCRFVRELLILLDFLVDILIVQNSESLKSLSMILVTKVLVQDYQDRSLTANEVANQLLIGILHLLKRLLPISTPSQMLKIIYDECLFTLPFATNHRKWPLCVNMETRKPALSLLAKLASSSPEVMEELIKRLSQLIYSAGHHLTSKWSVDESQLESRAGGEHVGLKNQGCSCYINSFLQQIFMNLTIRQGLISAELPEESNPNEQVLRQVQRTFCYLKDSEMRFYNPKQLVEACKVLNLEFSVYQQNDASEFCDKLLDRLEIGLKNTPQGIRCLSQSLGGKLISQKLPTNCGHKYEREEPFIRLELSLRGNNCIEESLAEFVKGELMEGDNKVECELCNMKKNAIRRTCFGTLPNLLILHLKRFDLDYTTFETVKLNNRCSFPLELNMKPFTKQGLEELEEKANLDKFQTEDEEYIYELKGVLVHSGVAQGGHYYSFIVDRESGKWFKYDDEDVSLFDPNQIETECFGGVQTRTTTWHGVNNTMEMEVFSNALMLFYEKKNMSTQVDTVKVNNSSSRSVFEKEVWQANEVFMLNSYLFDTDFHDFLRELVSQSTNGENLGLQFVLKVLLHSREKPKIALWSNLLLKSKNKDLMLDVLLRAESSWLNLYLLQCPDTVARQAFVKLISGLVLTASNTKTIKMLAPKILTIFQTLVYQMYTTVPNNNNYLPHHNQKSLPYNNNNSPLQQSHSSYQSTPQSRLEEVFLLLRNLSKSDNPAWRQALVGSNVIAQLIVVFLGDRAPLKLREQVAQIFRSPEVSGEANHQHWLISYSTPSSSPEYQYLLESIAALLGIPCRETVPVLTVEKPKKKIKNKKGDLAKTDRRSLTNLFDEDHEDEVENDDNLGGDEEVSEEERNKHDEENSSSSGKEEMTLDDEFYETNTPSKKDLSRLAKRALRIVFTENSQEIGSSKKLVMGAKDLQAYFRRCGNVSIINAKATAIKIRNILTQYGHTIQQEMKQVLVLDCRGFLAFYRDLACDNSVKLVQDDLESFGFNSNTLTRDTPLHQNVNGCQWTNQIPDLSLAALTCENFYEASLEEDVEGICDLFVHIALHSFVDRTENAISSRKNLDFNRQYLKICETMLTHLLHVDAGWKGQCSIDAISQFFTLFLQAKQQELNQLDDVKEELLLLIFLNQDSGLLRGRHRQSNNPEPRVYHHNFTSSHRHNNSNSVHTSIWRQLELVMLLHRKIPFCRNWLNHHLEDWRWFYEWLCSTSIQQQQQQYQYQQQYQHQHTAARQEVMIWLAEIHSIALNEQDFSSTNLSNNYHCYIVQGAGNTAVNGIYQMTEHIHDECPVYTYKNRSSNVVFTLFRCCLPSTDRRWYISISKSLSSLGTSSDEDFYYIKTDVGVRQPPEHGWKIWSKNPHAQPPAPFVRLDTTDYSNHQHHQLSPVDHQQQQHIRDSDYMSGYDSEDEVHETNQRIQDIQLADMNTSRHDQGERSDFI